MVIGVCVCVGDGRGEGGEVWGEGGGTIDLLQRSCPQHVCKSRGSFQTLAYSRSMVHTLQNY